jgi:hypothetical protein
MDYLTVTTDFPPHPIEIESETSASPIFAEAEYLH